jgi:glycosyltransferase involved in cell wall biosynthesis
MPENPLVSIVIPTYNQRKNFLRECIESAISQTYKNIEIVISDNYSTNDAPRIIAEYAARDERVRVVKPPRFLNMSESFLYVFQQAAGKYCCYISSDDILFPACIEVLIQKMEENDDVLFSHGEAEYFTKDNSTTVEWKYFNEKKGVYGLNLEVAERLLSFKYVCFGGCLVRSSILPEINIFLQKENLIIKNYIDLLLTILLFNKGKVFFNNAVLARIRIENDTRNLLNTYLIKDAAEIWIFLEKNKNLYFKFEHTGVDIRYFKKKQFIEFVRALIYEYNQNSIGLSDFRIAKENLKLFNLNSPIKYYAYIFMASRYPRLTNMIYKIKKTFL